MLESHQSGPAAHWQASVRLLAFERLVQREVNCFFPLAGTQAALIATPRLFAWRLLYRYVYRFSSEALV